MPWSLPDTAPVRAAQELLRAALPADLYQHSCRTYLLASAWARRRGIGVDDEGLCLASLFHDAGLCPRWCDTSLPFTFNGSRALRVFLAGHGVPDERVSPLADAIDHHMHLRPRWSKGPVAGLLQVGAWMDCTGLRVWSVWPESREIARHHPRLGLTWKVPIHLLGSLGSPASCLGLFFPERFREGAGSTLTSR